MKSVSADKLASNENETHNKITTFVLDHCQHGDRVAKLIMGSILSVLEPA